MIGSVITIYSLPKNQKTVRIPFFSFTLKPAESEFLDKKDIVARSLIYSPLYHHMRFFFGLYIKMQKRSNNCRNTHNNIIF